MRPPLVLAVALGVVLVWQVFTRSVVTVPVVAGPQSVVVPGPPTTAAAAVVDVGPETDDGLVLPVAADFGSVVVDEELVAAAIGSRSPGPASGGAAATAAAAAAGGGGVVVGVRAPGVNSPIEVDASIAGDVAGLLAAAEADGVVLGGWGWRSHERQIELRREHCGRSEWAVWEMPSSQCSPPTARPGRSNHETGLAIDFTVDGTAIGSRRSVAFRWLAANAAGFGLKNLPGEPWHWSVNGN